MLLLGRLPVGLLHHRLLRRRLLRLLERKMDGKTNYIIYGSQSDSKASIKIEKEEGVPRD